jgi:hypothetical protein
MTDSIQAGLEEMQRVEAARAFLDQQLDKQDCILTPEEYYRCLANLVAAIPPFKRPKFHVCAALLSQQETSRG